MAIAATSAALASAIVVGPAPGADAAVTATLSITARSAFKVVSGDVFVAYDSGKYSAALIVGTAKGFGAGRYVGQLWSSQFPYSASRKLVETEAVTVSAGATKVFSFKRAPDLATRYWVHLVTGSKSVSSKDTVVYDVAGGSVSPSSLPPCSRPVCHRSFTQTLIFPGSTVKTETRKSWYTYLGLNLNPTKEPKPPTTLSLTKSASVGPFVKVSSTKYSRKVSISFTIGNDGYYYHVNWCAQDSESVDGLGLPGHHGCGDKTIPASLYYLG